MFPARQEHWRKARAFIESFCQGAHLARDTCLKCNLVVEELFLNTVKYGHNGGSDAPIWITLSAANGTISLTYEDRAPPFNPFPKDGKEMFRKLAANRTEGGLGVLLAHGLTVSARYTYLFGRNRVQLTLE